MADEENFGTKDVCIILYALLAISMILQLAAGTMLFGFLLMLGVVAYAESQRKKMQGTFFENHFRWISRTFWIGTGVYLPVLLVIAMALIYGMDRSSIENAVMAGSMDVDAMMRDFLIQNRGPGLYAIMGLTLFYTLWWLYRCWYGYYHLKQGKVIEDVKSWI